MRTIIAGSRGIMSYRTVADAIEYCGWTPTTILSGCARGVDQLGEQYAKANGIPIERYPAEWDQHGRSAGYKRNAVMAGRADALVAIWDGKSRGTKHMIEISEDRKLQVYVLRA